MTVDNKGTILLTSTGLSGGNIFNYFKNLKLQNNYTSVVILSLINKPHVELAKDQLDSMGFKNIDRVLFKDALSCDYSKYDVIYVCGGNTFKILEEARVCGLKNHVIELLDRGGCYVGVSAGALIMSPTIDSADEIVPDINDANLQDLTGLDLVSFPMAVHYEENQEEDVRIFEKKYSTEVVRLADGQGIVAMGDVVRRI
jgi:dipeptidase E